MTTSKCGIYKISNKIDSRIYIGSALNIRLRKHVHWTQLKKGYHHSKHLQRFVNKYGINNLIHSVVEIVSEIDDLINREQFYIDKLNCLSPNGFNLNPTAGSHKGRIVSKEQVEKRKQTMLKNGGFYKHKEETKNRISLTMKKVVKSKEHLHKLSILNKKKRDASIERKRLKKEAFLLKRQRVVISPKGEIITINNMVEFCNKHNFNSSGFYRLLRKTYPSYKGYTLPK